ncbi:manganese-dependent inorganic pyrophosphatase [Alkalibaculum bacchi]|uniref:inorganic diphosphatase n=1 Tax=Alkalibaculum bacchi TaxID=645887 RepID=A0A366I5T8_9FIRM|nr:putative manganese-dependent inorganic diphosphatase [Alkalibaculum bacchi]RBP63832.1 manganese-dependent inorganic pyrophosphatase [Alkalibaculum bacchi]
MDRKTLIFGHKNPDTDSVTSAISFSYLKNSLGENTEPYILGEISKETEFVLHSFQIDKPVLLENVRTQIRDLNYDKIATFKSKDSILDAYNFMTENRVRTLPIIFENNKFAGLITMKDIAMSLIKEDQRKLHSCYTNVLNGLEGHAVSRHKEHIDGNILVTAFHLNTIEKLHLLTEDSIVIVGDRDEVIKAAIEKGVALIVITGESWLSDDLLEEAMNKKVNIIRTKMDTYSTSKLIYLTNYASNIMIDQDILFFRENEYLDECKEVIRKSGHSKFPIVDEEGYYLGILGRSHIISPKKKRVILVDHNEYAQSADGIEQAEILEIVDHHKIGDISTNIPIGFRNLPVGSTNTIIYQMYKENQIKIPHPIAGIMISGIISDTLLLKSPTTTKKDVQAVEELTELLGMDLQDYAMEMFRKGTDITGLDVHEVFFNDYKEFSLEGMRVGVAQVFTLNIESVKEKTSEYLNIIEETNAQKGQFATLLIVTDIIRQGSYLFYNENRKNILEASFNKKMEQGTFIEECVSRKKQIIPALIEGIRNSK